MLVLCNFLRKLMVSDKRFTGLLELIQLYKQKPLEIFVIFTIYQNYTLALYHESFIAVIVCAFLLTGAKTCPV